MDRIHEKINSDVCINRLRRCDNKHVRVDVIIISVRERRIVITFLHISILLPFHDGESKSDYKYLAYFKRTKKEREKFITALTFQVVTVKRVNRNRSFMCK